MREALNFPDNPKLLLKWLDEYDLVIPIIYQEQIGNKVVVSIYANDFLNLLSKAQIAPLMFCSRCGQENNYLSQSFTSQGYTQKGKKVWACKKCGKKTCIAPINERK